MGNKRALELSFKLTVVALQSRPYFGCFTQYRIDSEKSTLVMHNMRKTFTAIFC
jgi:hypothetical protein